MSKKVYEGWVPNECSPSSFLSWYGGTTGTKVLISTGNLNQVYLEKGDPSDWASWPPKRITVTIEVED